MPDATLLMLLDDIRGKTLGTLKGLDDRHARWAPPGLQNSCLWHAGHAYVVTEFLTMQSIGREPLMPEGWLKMFSWESNPAHVSPEHWPPLDVVVEKLQEQHQRLKEIIGALTPEQLDKVPPGDSTRTPRFAILHGLHDEARHSGESALLRKMMERTFVVEPRSTMG